MTLEEDGVTTLGDERRLPPIGKAGVEAWRQMPQEWLTFPARDRLHRWLENRKARKLLVQALDEALEGLAETLEAEPEATALEDMLNERFFSDPQVMGTFIACFTSDEPVDYPLLMRLISSGDERLRRRILEAFVTHLRAHLAAASAEFRLQIPVQSATRMKAILAAEQAQRNNQRQLPADRQQAPSQRAHAAPTAPVPAASIQMNTREKQERAMDQVGMQAGQDTSQGIALAVELEAQGRIQEAIALYESLLRQMPTNGKVHFNLAMLLTERGRLEEAEAHCRAATQALRDYPDAWGLYAYLLFLLRREPESLECARRAVALGFPRKRLAGLLKLEPAAL